MDLTTLPPELLVIIMKYLKPAELVSLRKRSKLICQVANYYGISKRLPIQRLQICLAQKKSSISVWIEKSLETVYNIKPYNGRRILPGYLGLECTKQHNSEGVLTYLNLVFYLFHHNMLAKVLQRVRVIDQCIFGSQIHISYSRVMKNQFNGTIIKTLEKEAEAIKPCKAIYFYYTKLECSEVQAKTFMNLFPKALILVMQHTPGYEVIMDLEVIRAINWSAILVISSDDHRPPRKCSHFTDSFLENIAKNGAILNIGSYSTDFSFGAVLSALQIMSANDGQTGKSDWGLVHFDAVDLDFAKEQLMKIPELKVEVRNIGRFYSPHANSFLFTVTFRNNIKEVRFSKQENNFLPLGTF